MGLLILVLESVLAGAILVGIVWWTMRPARKRDRDDERQ
jgi:cbb3-type cytochrome oxidase subunit 3